MGTLLDFWQKLHQITHLTFMAHSHLATGWNGRGEGVVKVVKEEENQLIFIEKGRWQNQHSTFFAFSNQLRWRLKEEMGMISLEHLRHGVNRPVFLFHLVPTACDTLTAVDSHLCREDCYFGQICIKSFSFDFSWQVTGPKKNEKILTHYF